MKAELGVRADAMEKLKKRLKKGSKITLTHDMPDGSVKTTLCRVLSAKTRAYKTGPVTMVHIEEIAG